jgi:hypothetical protein
MMKTLLASTALALVLGMSGSAFAAPGDGNPQGDGGPNGVETCDNGGAQAGVTVQNLRSSATPPEVTPGDVVAGLKGDDTGAGDFVQESHSYCDIGRYNTNPS